MRKILLGTVISLNVILMIITAVILFKEMSSPVPSGSGIKKKIVKADKVKTSAKKSTKAERKKEAEKAKAPARDVKSAYISINSSPSSAKVFINGYYKARTPASIKLTSVSEVPRNYSIKVFKQGYYSWEKKIILARNSTKEFSINLIKK